VRPEMKYVLRCWWGTKSYTDWEWARCPSVRDVWKVLKTHVTKRARRENRGKPAGRIDWALVEFPRGSGVGTCLLRGWEVDE